MFFLESFLQKAMEEKMAAASNYLKIIFEKGVLFKSQIVFVFVKLLLVMYRFKRKRENETMHHSTLSCCVLHSKPITTGPKGASLWLTAIPLKDQGSAQIGRAHV